MWWNWTNQDRAFNTAGKQEMLVHTPLSQSWLNECCEIFVHIRHENVCLHRSCTRSPTMPWASCSPPSRASQTSTRRRRWTTRAWSAWGSSTKSSQTLTRWDRRLWSTPGSTSPPLFPRLRLLQRLSVLIKTLVYSPKHFRADWCKSRAALCGGSGGSYFTLTLNQQNRTDTSSIQWTIQELRTCTDFPHDSHHLQFMQKSERFEFLFFLYPICPPVF